MPLSHPGKPQWRRDEKDQGRQMTARLQGIFTPNLVPLDSRGDINEPELRRYIETNLAGQMKEAAALKELI